MTLIMPALSRIIVSRVALAQPGMPPSLAWLKLDAPVNKVLPFLMKRQNEPGRVSIIKQPVWVGAGSSKAPNPKRFFLRSGILIAGLLMKNDFQVERALRPPPGAGL
jgi:hypothetical protein